MESESHSLLLTVSVKNPSLCWYKCVQTALTTKLKAMSELREFAESQNDCKLGKHIW